VAQFGGACLGRAGGRRSWVFTTARGSESLRTRWGGRLAAAFGGRRRSRAGPPAGALQRGVGPGRVVWWRLLLVVAFVPGPSSLSSPGGNHPGLAVSSRIARCCGRSSFGWTPPVRDGWQSPPTATRDPGQPHLWEGFPRLMPAKSRPHVCREVDPVHTTGVVSRIPRRCRRAKPSGPGRWCQAGRFRRPAGVIRLDTTGPACFRQATTATRDPGQRRPQATTAAQQRHPAPPPVAERPPEAPALHHGFDFDFQTPHLTAGRQRSARHPTELRHQRILLKPVRSRQKTPLTVKTQTNRTSTPAATTRATTTPTHG